MVNGLKYLGIFLDFFEKKKSLEWFGLMKKEKLMNPIFFIRITRLFIEIVIVVILFIGFRQFVQTIIGYEYLDGICVDEKIYITCVEGIWNEISIRKVFKSLCRRAINRWRKTWVGCEIIYVDRLNTKSKIWTRRKEESKENRV